MTVTDNGFPSRQAVIIFTINVTDVNEFSPEFQNTPYEFTALAHYSPGTFLGTALLLVSLFVCLLVYFILV